MAENFLSMRMHAVNGWFEYDVFEPLEILGLSYIDDGIKVAIMQHSRADFISVSYKVEHDTYFPKAKYLKIEAENITCLPDGIDLIVCEGNTILNVSSDIDTDLLTIKSAATKNGTPTIEIKNIHRLAIPIDELPAFCSNNPQKRFNASIISYIKNKRPKVFELLPAHVKLQIL